MMRSSDKNPQTQTQTQAQAQVQAAEITRLKRRIAKLEAQLEDKIETKSRGDMLWDYIDHVLFNLPIGIAILEGTDFRYFRINQYLADFNHLPVADHLGRPLAEVLPHVAPSLLPILTKVLTTSKGTEQREFTITLPNGDTKYLMDFHFPVAGEVVISVVLDISKQKRLEQALNSSNKELDQQYRTLKETQHQLIQTAKLASMGQLTAGLAHELNQPLGRILLTAELARNKLQMQALSQPGQLIEYLSRIMKDVNNATTLINHLKTYSRQDVKSVIVDMELKKLVQETMILFNHQIEVRDIDFTLTFEHQCPRLPGDPGQIEQVLNNLFSNALDALQEKEKEKEQEDKKDKSKQQLQLATYDSDRYTCIAVRDSGCGMTRATMDNIFDPFFTTKLSGEGTGLGLSICRGIIDNHRGKLTVESEEGKGSCFVIWLPNAG